MYRPSSRSGTTQRRSSQYNRTRRRKQIKKEEKQRRKQQQDKKDSSVQARYAMRQRRFVARYGRLGRPLHMAAWLLHNNIAHPLLGLAPGTTSLHIHDVTARWLNLQPTTHRSPRPEILHRREWVVHNCISHPLMGVMPMRWHFAWHDTTAARMKVQDWV